MPNHQRDRRPLFFRKRRVKNCAASSRIMSPLNATKFATQKP